MKKKRAYSIRKQLLRLLLTVGVAFILLCTGVYSAIALRQAREAQAQYFGETASSLAKRLDQMVDQMDVIACEVLSSYDLQTVVRRALHADLESNYFDLHLDARRAAQDTLWLFNSPKKVVSGINVFVGQSFVGLHEAPSAAVIRQTAALDCWQTPERGLRLLAPHEDYWRQSGETVLSLLRAFIATNYSFERIGTIEVQVTQAQLLDALSTQEDDAAVWLLDDSGAVLFPLAAQGSVMEISPATDDCLRFDGACGEPHIGATATLASYPWRVALARPLSGYRAALWQALWAPLLIGLCLLVLTVLAFAAISRAFAAPIRALTEAVGKVTLENVCELEALNTPLEEVGLLRDAFLSRTGELRDAANQLVSASESELKLKLSVLQAHINPHFLYNSLTAISAAGQQNGCARVEEMCYQLAELYRYTDAERPERVTLADELSNVQIYLTFMKYRYEDHLLLDVGTEGDLQSVTIPRLVLQPLVENCFSHGFQTVAPPFRMRVRCTARADGWTFSVGDNGGGFAPDMLALLRERVAFVDQVFAEKRDYGRLSVDGMALINVYIRLKTMLPGAVTLRLERDELLGGACVRIDTRAR